MDLAAPCGAAAATATPWLLLLLLPLLVASAPLLRAAALICTGCVGAVAPRGAAPSARAAGATTVAGDVASTAVTPDPAAGCRLAARGSRLAAGQLRELLCALSALCAAALPRVAGAVAPTDTIKASARSPLPAPASGRCDPRCARVAALRISAPCEGAACGGGAPLLNHVTSLAD